MALKKIKIDSVFDEFSERLANAANVRNKLFLRLNSLFKHQAKVQDNHAIRLDALEERPGKIHKKVLADIKDRLAELETGKQALLEVLGRVGKLENTQYNHTGTVVNTCNRHNAIAQRVSRIEKRYEEDLSDTLKRISKFEQTEILTPDQLQRVHKALDNRIDTHANCLETQAEGIGKAAERIIKCNVRVSKLEKTVADRISKLENDQCVRPSSVEMVKNDVATLQREVAEVRRLLSFPAASVDAEDVSWPPRKVDKVQDMIANFMCTRNTRRLFAIGASDYEADTPCSNLSVDAIRLLNLIFETLGADDV